MKILPNGHFYLEKGEHYPYICPKCRQVKEWYEADAPVTCDSCGYSGDPDEFCDGEYVLIQ